MKHMLKHALSAIILVLSFAAPVAATAAEDSLAVARRYAEQGDGIAQYSLGRAYEQGD